MSVSFEGTATLLASPGPLFGLAPAVADFPPVAAGPKGPWPTKTSGKISDTGLWLIAASVVLWIATEIMRRVANPSINQGGTD